MPKISFATTDNNKIVLNTSVSFQNCEMCYHLLKLCFLKIWMLLSHLSPSHTCMSQLLLSHLPFEIHTSHFSYPVCFTFATSVFDQISHISQQVSNTVPKMYDISLDAKLLSPIGISRTHSTKLNSLNDVLVTELKTFSETYNLSNLLKITFHFLSNLNLRR